MDSLDNGFKGFVRCQPLRFVLEDTPEDAVAAPPPALLARRAVPLVFGVSVVFGVFVVFGVSVGVVLQPPLTCA